MGIKMDYSKYSCKWYQYMDYMSSLAITIINMAPGILSVATPNQACSALLWFLDVSNLLEAPTIGTHAAASVFVTAEWAGRSVSLPPSHLAEMVVPPKKNPCSLECADPPDFCQDREVKPFAQGWWSKSSRSAGVPLWRSQTLSNS